MITSIWINPERDRLAVQIDDEMLEVFDTLAVPTEVTEVDFVGDWRQIYPEDDNGLTDPPPEQL